MQKLFTLSLVLLSTLVSISQSFELCLDEDTLRIDNSGEPYELYHILSPGSGCYANTTETACAANSTFCVWELSEECVPRNQNASTAPRPVNAIILADSCKIATTQTECESRTFFACTWAMSGSGFSCFTSSSSVYDVPVIVENKVVIDQINMNYIFRFSSTEALSFRVSDIDPCSPVTGTQEPYRMHNSIYPNPATMEELNIVFDQPLSGIVISVYNQNGVLVDFINNVSGESVQLNTTKWSKGIYTVVVNVDGQTSSQTVVK